MQQLEWKCRHYVSVYNIFRRHCWEQSNKLKSEWISCKTSVLFCFFFLPQTAGAGSQLSMLQTSGCCLTGISSAAEWFHFGSHILSCTVSTQLFLCQVNAHLWRSVSVCTSFLDSAACPCQLEQKQQQVNLYFMSNENLKAGTKENRSKLILKH